MSASAKDRDKIRRIFRFLQELHQVKSPPLIDTAQYEWKISYDAVPRFASVQRGDADSGFILKAARPAESHCPKPSIAIEKWLKSGWEQFGVEPELYRSEEHTSELQSPCNLVCRLLLEKKTQLSDHSRSAHPWLFNRRPRHMAHPPHAPLC